MPSLQSVLLFLGAAILGFFIPSVGQPKLGQALPSATATFETSLQSAITSSATTMTLTANAVRGGGALSGFNCFAVDEGSAQAETICGTVSGTSVTSLTRGISQSTGTTTVAALQFAHRRGANVKITDFPLIQILKAQLNGEDTIPNALLLDSAARYTSAPTFTASSNQLASVLYAENYANAVIAGGAPTSTETVGGKVRLSTQLQMASSTDLGVTAPLVIQAKYSTSSPSGAGIWNVITRNSGKIAQAFLDFTESWNFTGTTFIKNLNASSSIAVGGVTYNFPANQASASTTALMNDGNGNVFWTNPPIKILYLASPNTGTSATATTSLAVVKIPANTLGGGNTSLRISGEWTSYGASVCYGEVDFGNGTATSTIVFGGSQSNTGVLAHGDVWIYASSTATALAHGTFSSTPRTDITNATGPTTPTVISGGIFMGYSLAASTYVSFAARSTTGAVACTFIGGSVELLSY